MYDGGDDSSGAVEGLGGDDRGRRDRRDGVRPGAARADLPDPRRRGRRVGRTGHRRATGVAGRGDRARPGADGRGESSGASLRRPAGGDDRRRRAPGRRAGGRAAGVPGRVRARAKPGSRGTGTPGRRVSRRDAAGAGVVSQAIPKGDRFPEGRPGAGFRRAPASARRGGVDPGSGARDRPARADSGVGRGRAVGDTVPGGRGADGAGPLSRPRGSRTRGPGRAGRGPAGQDGLPGDPGRSAGPAEGIGAGCAGPVTFVRFVRFVREEHVPLSRRRPEPTAGQGGQRQRTRRRDRWIVGRLCPRVSADRDAGRGGTGEAGQVPRRGDAGRARRGPDRPRSWNRPTAQGGP